MNRAATFTLGLIENVSAEQWSHIFNVSIRGYALMVKHIVPLLKQQRSGSIIQFGSISGSIAQPGFIPYSTTKAAVIQMTRNLALDLGTYNIRCNSVSPGCIGSLRAHIRILFTCFVDDRHIDFVVCFA
jgi:NAD(P)-dependent dehydrogenase (short-subunit alcohol dehydrogenase family)